MSLGPKPPGRRTWLILCAAVLLAAGSVWAQAVSDGTLTGTVTLATGERVPGATVTITSPALVAGERTTVSNAEGRFVFLSIPPGTYNLSAKLQGFKSHAAQGIVVHSGDRVDIPVELAIGAVEEEIVVTAAAPVVDTRTSTIDTTFTEDLIQKVPTSRNAFYDLAVTAPGMASVGSEESWLPSPSAFGSAANENIFLVNGVNTTNPRGAPWGSLVTVNYNTVEEVKVLSLGSKAEYGSFSGAAIDVLTKSGGNEFSGDLAYFTQIGNASDNATLDFGDDVLYANPNDVLTSKPVDNEELSFAFGGPVVRDMLWFYGGYGTYESATDTPLFEPLALWNADLYDLKLTGDFSANHRAWLAYHMEDLRSDNTTWGQTWDGTMVYSQPRDNDTLQFQYQWVISDRDIFSFKSLGFQTEENPSIPNTTGRPGFINWWKWIGTQSIGLGGDFPYVEAQKSERQTFQGDISHYADNFLGEHEIKFGVQFTSAEGNWQGGYFHGYANFAYPYPWDYGPAENWWWNGPESWQWGTDEDPVFPMYNRQVHRNPWLTVRQSDSTGVFFDDTWVVNDRLTVNAGLRYDNMTADYGEGAVYEMPSSPEDINNPVVLRTRAGQDVFDFDTWSPRLGIAWTLTEDRKTVLRAHAGRYYAPLGVESLRRFGPDMEPDHTQVWMHLLKMSEVDLNGNGRVDFDEVRPATRLLAGRTPDSLFSESFGDPSWFLDVADGTDSPHTDQFHVSVQREIGSNFSVELGYIYKLSKDMISLRPFNTATGEYWDWEERPFTTYTGYDTSIWSIMLKDYNGDGVANVDDAKFVLGNTAYRAVNADTWAPGNVDRDYHGVQLVFNKRYSNRWQGLAAVNWNTSDGIAPRTVDQNWYIDGPMVMDTPFGSSLNHFQNNLSGPLPMTPELMIKVSGSYMMPVIETDLGLRLRYDSGRPMFPVQGLPTFASWMADISPDVILGTWADQIVADDPDDPYYMPATTILDLSLGKAFTVAEYGSVRVSLDVLNALNDDSPNRMGFRQGDFGRVYNLVQPRTYRAGVKYSF